MSYRHFPMKEPKSILKTELSFIEWVETLQKDVEAQRLQELEQYNETKYIDGFLQALELTRLRYLKDQGIHTFPPKVYREFTQDD